MWSFSPAQRWSCSLESIWMETLSLSEAGDDQSCTVAVAFSYLIIWLWQLFKLLEKQTQPVPKAHLMQSGRHLGVWIKLNKCFEAAQGPTAVDLQHKQMTSVKSAGLSLWLLIERFAQGRIQINVTGDVSWPPPTAASFRTTFRWSGFMLLKGDKGR